MAPMTGVGSDPHIELSQAAQCGDYSTLDTILSFGKVEIRRPGQLPELHIILNI